MVEYAEIVEASAQPRAPWPVGEHRGPGGAEPAGQGARGVPIGNTHPATRTSPASEDMAELSAWVTWEDAETLFKRLKMAQDNAKAARDDEEAREDSKQNTSSGARMENGEEEYCNPIAGQGVNPGHTSSAVRMGESGEDDDEDGIYGAGIPIGDVFWFMMTYGVGGQKRGMAHYEFVLVEGSRKLLFRRNTTKRIPNLRVILGSIALAQANGLARAWNEILDVVSELGGRIERHVISRVDMYTDVAGVSTSEFQTRYENGWRVSRARTATRFGEDDAIPFDLHDLGRKKTGFSHGSGLKIRVYDKRLEMAHDPLKQQVFAQRYGGTLPETLTRVEFQLRRDQMSYFEIGGDRVDTVEEYERKKVDLWVYLTGDWFRLADGPVDWQNRNQHKAPEWGVWRLVQAAGNPDAKQTLGVRRVKRVAPVIAEQLLKQGVSCIVKFAVHAGHKITAWPDYMDVQQVISTCLPETELLGMAHRHEDERAARVSDA